LYDEGRVAVTDCFKLLSFISMYLVVTPPKELYKGVVYLLVTFIQAQMEGKNAS